MMALRDAKNILRTALLSASDEKLAEMLAWAQDGKMDYWNPCACFVGSIGPYRVHEECDDGGHHYCMTLDKHRGSSYAYAQLGLIGILPAIEEAKLRQRRVVPILKAQIRLRSRARKNISFFLQEPAEILA
jgi:hypothetical protein